MSGHPDILEIDAVRRGEGTAVDVAHVRNCGECRAAMSDLERIAAALTAPPSVPAEIDAAILWNARKRALQIRRRRVWRTAYGFAAAAAVVLALTSLLRPAPRQTSETLAVASRAEPAPRAAAVGAADLDGDGRVDILDAFALARAVETHSGGRDVNGDGVVDGRDVAVLTARAVSLGGV